tara:strand:- start:11944 stop:12057 length:114 start_codon:yes stop_codon:yes gene_type:complete
MLSDKHGGGPIDEASILNARQQNHPIVYCFETREKEK